MIYLDNNATTRVAPEVFEAMQPYLNEVYGNPSSAHSLGQEMKAAVEHAREQVAALIGAADPGEIVFTSCGSESDNWAIGGFLEQNPTRRHIITTRVEHEAVRNLCEHLAEIGCEVTWLDVNEIGELNLDDLRRTLRRDTGIVSVMLANNETGVLFPMEEIGKIVRENSDAVFHVDGVQAVGKIPLDLKNSSVDLFALSGHKLHAPQGVGALYIRSGVKLPPFIIGGGQERGRRAGTSAVPNIVGLGAACELARTFEEHERIERLRNKLEDEILSAIPNARLNGTPDRSQRLPNTTNISFEYVEGENILLHLDKAGVCVSTGSACHSATKQSSPTLRAMNVPYTAAQGSIRFSLGRYNTEEEIDYTLKILPEIISKLVEMSPYDKELRALTMRQL
ncbi:MAG TPA: cysteine desulfurase NifS [Blastocatellia bacterium]|nr:cysteine desulfurase NifS [Blastocatellia bacterium]HAF25536.1 cysteine desulfurase NifS [Blastocatellia bacterium]HCX30696.1 cysteine desulfurase NifS [Blastocatellia bacterium]